MVESNDSLNALSPEDQALLDKQIASWTKERDLLNEKIAFAMGNATARNDEESISTAGVRHSVSEAVATSPISTLIEKPQDLHQTTDAVLWAKEFCRIAEKLYPGNAMIDEAWVTSWFANAFMTQYDEDRRRSEIPVADNLIRNRIYKALCDVGDWDCNKMADAAMRVFQRLPKKEAHGGAALRTTLLGKLTPIYKDCSMAELLNAIMDVLPERESEIWCPNAERRYTAADLQELLNGRDDFIVSQGLWDAFAKQVGQSQPVRETGGGVETLQNALQAILLTYKNNDVAGIDVMAQIAIDHLRGIPRFHELLSQFGKQPITKIEDEATK